MGEWGIQNYQPCWSNLATELLQLMAQIPLTGLQVQSAWSLWDEERDEWFSDAPIVICTQEKQLEFCATRLNEFSFSLDSIDLSISVNWCGSENFETKPFRWIQEKNPEFKNLAGEIITGIEIVESYASKDMQTFLGVEAWMLSGIALQFNQERLEILNGLDCNALSRNRETDREVRYIQVESLK